MLVFGIPLKGRNHVHTMIPARVSSVFSVRNERSIIVSHANIKGEEGFLKARRKKKATMAKPSTPNIANRVKY